MRCGGRSAPPLNIPTVWWTIRGWWCSPPSMPHARGAEIRTGARCTRAERGSDMAAGDEGSRLSPDPSPRARWPTPPAPGRRRSPRRCCACRRRKSPLCRWTRSWSAGCSISDNVYVFQNFDGRLIFASPYQRDFTLIGDRRPRLRGRSRHRRDGHRRTTSPISATRRTAIFASGSRRSTWCARFPAPTWR